MPVEQINWDKQDIVTCDERGRATLGKEFADEQVFVYIARPPDINEIITPSEEERQVLTKMVRWAKENIDVEWFDLNARSGVVTDKYGGEHQTPYKYYPDDEEE